MVQYIQALEGFDRECEAMHTNIIMGEFMATESVGSSIKAGVQAAWEKLKKLVLGIWEKIKSFAGKIKSGVQALIAMIRKSPDDAYNPGKNAREMSEWLKANDKLMENTGILLDIVFKDFDDLRSLGKKLSKADAAEIDALEKELEDILTKYEAAVKEEKAAKAECEKWDAECDRLVKEDWTKNPDAEAEYAAASDARKNAYNESGAASTRRMRTNGDAFMKAVGTSFKSADLMKRNGLDPKKNNPPKSKTEGSEDSYIGDGFMEPATEAEGGRKFNLSGLKQKLMSVLNRSEKATQASEQFINEVKSDFESIKNSASDERTANRKQSLLSKILNFGSRCFNFVKSIPGKIKEMFGRLWRFFHRPKSQVKPYNGPSPVAATDSYLYDPELAVEIG